MSFNVFRMNVSTYQAPNFKELEKKELEKLEKIGFVESISDCPDIIISNSNSHMTSIPPQVFSQLKLIIHPNSGYDNFSPEFVQECPCPIIAGNPIREYAVSEYILSCLSHRYSSPPFTSNWDPKRTWERKLLSKEEVLLVGFGHIGKIIEKSLSPLVKKIHIVDPYKGKLKSIMDTPLENCGAVILCAGLNPSSKYIINKNVLDKLPKEVTIINGARGKLINQEDLFNFLTFNCESSAYLDVFNIEPFKDKNELKNLYKSSHIAGVFTGLDQDIISFEKKILSDFLSFQNNLHLFEAKYKDLLLKFRIQKSFLI